VQGQPRLRTEPKEATVNRIHHYIHRRLLPSLMAGVMALSGLVTAVTPLEALARGERGERGAKYSEARKEARKNRQDRVAKDLAEELQAPRHKKKDKARWSREVNGVHMVQLLVTSDGADPQMRALRAEVGSPRRQGAGRAPQPADPDGAAAGHQGHRAVATRRREAHHPQPRHAKHRQRAGIHHRRHHRGVRTYSTNTSYTGLDGTGVGIAILDSGVMKAHKNFLNAGGASRVKRSVNLLNAALYDWSNPWDGTVSLQPGSAALASYEATIAADTATTQDAYGHGTHVASVAAGRGFYQSPDATGVAPNANIYDVRVLNSLGIGTMSDAIEGINWVMYHAREYNIRVLNISLAAQSTDTYGDDPLCHAVRMATAMGITVVAAGGNFGLNLKGQEVYGAISSPGNEPSAITVGSVNTLTTTARSDDKINMFSSRGPTRGVWVDPTTKIAWPDDALKPDLVAPGNKVLGASATKADAASPTKNTLATLFPTLESAVPTPTTYGQRLMVLSGTSIAAPAVAGAAAVLLQANPGLTPPLVKAILQYTAQPLPGHNLLQQGAGLLNLEGAVKLAQSLRTDIHTAVQAGTISAGANLLATGKTLPTARSSTIGGQAFNWSRIVYVGGNRIATGDRLFTTFQPIWDPRTVWGDTSTVVRTVPTYWSGTGIAANTFPKSFTMDWPLDLRRAADQWRGARGRAAGRQLAAGQDGCLHPHAHADILARGRQWADPGPRADPQRGPHPQRRADPERGPDPE
jgi:serine protease AprX